MVTLNRPKLPAIPGIDEFEGHTFHTSRWDYDYTGGDHSGGLTKLADKRVAVIGTGATAIQCVPFVGAHAKQLYVFQRTPSSVDVRGNKPTDTEWAKTLKPGWQRERRENFNNLVIGVPVGEDLVADGWTDIFRNLGIAAKKSARAKELSKRETAQLMEIADFQKMNGVRARVDQTISDPATAGALKRRKSIAISASGRPSMTTICRLSTCKPNVKLIDTSERATASSGSPRTASSPTVSSTKWIASCFATGLRGRLRPGLGAPATKWSAWMAQP